MYGQGHVDFQIFVYSGASNDLSDNILIGFIASSSILQCSLFIT